MGFPVFGVLKVSCFPLVLLEKIIHKSLGVHSKAGGRSLCDLAGVVEPSSSGKRGESAFSLEDIWCS